jgi:MFS family permease
MNTVLAELYPNDYTKDVKTRVSNAFLIGEVFGMLFFGWAIDKLGRRNGIFWATFFLVLGLVISTAAHGTSVQGMFWMMIIGRGVAGFGAGGERRCEPRYLKHSNSTADIDTNRRIPNMCYECY